MKVGMMRNNLPPNCRVSDIPGNRPEDDFQDMIADGWRPKCKFCGGFLTLEPESFTQITRMCEGKATKYTEKYSEALITILGEEYRNQTYDIYFVQGCDEGECGPEGHAKHEIYEGTELERTCHNCGQVNKELSY
jgi:hypothetical protein